jgi:hypothetical protein
MGRLRRAAALGVATVAVVVVNVDCAEPTQIVVDIRTEAALCDAKRPVHIVSTGVAVASPERLEETFLDQFEGEGCDAQPYDRIGTLVITPSGEKDEEVSIRVVSGVDVSADRCPTDFKGCIVARRHLRFAPRTSKRIVVIMSPACIGKSCGSLECDLNGACVPPDRIRDDGRVD